MFIDGLLAQAHLPIATLLDSSMLIEAAGW